jgi:peptidyl-prolyl cis-trans isomerase D
MMETLRNFLTGPRLFIVIAACALPFVFLGTGSLGSTFNNSLGTINGENVTQTDYQIAGNMASQRLKSIYGDNFELSDLDEEFKNNQIQQELIAQKVLLSESRKLGFINNVTQNQSKKEIIANSSFHTDGRFDENIYEAQVNANGYTKESYLDVVTNMLATDLYRQAIASNNFITNKELVELTSLLEQSANIDFLKIDYQKLRNEIINSEDEIRDYYDANKVSFYSNEARSFKYFIISSDDYASSVQIPEDYVENEYANYLALNNQNKQIRFSHIMLEKSKYDSPELALEKVSTVLDQLKSGEDFSILASKYSDDMVTKDIGGDLEYFDADVFPSEFNEAINKLALNEYSDIIELDETYHILKVTELSLNEVIPLSDMQSQFIDNLVSSESIALMNDDYNLIDEKIFNNDSFQSIADTLSKDIQTSENVSKESFEFLIDDSRIKDYIFSPETSIGNSYAISIDNSIVVLSLSKITEPELMEYEKVRELAQDYLLSDKAVEKLSLISQEITEANAEGELNKFIEPYDFISQESFIDIKRYSSLLPQEVTSKIFEGSVGDPLKVSARSGDMYHVTIKSFNKLDDESISDIIEQYKGFAEERSASTLTTIINQDLFNSARVNLNTVIF